MSMKFQSVQAERLWGLAGESEHDQEIGTAEAFGWYALFEREQSIVWTNEQGFVGSRRFDSPGELSMAWTEVEMCYDRWYVEQVDASECDALFLLIDTARHGGWTVTAEEIAEHAAACDTCVED